jgi:hypothetical protein
MSKAFSKPSQPDSFKQTGVQILFRPPRTTLGAAIYGATLGAVLGVACGGSYFLGHHFLNDRDSQNIPLTLNNMNACFQALQSTPYRSSEYSPGQYSKDSTVGTTYCYEYKQDSSQIPPRIDGNGKPMRTYDEDEFTFYATSEYDTAVGVTKSSDNGGPETMDIAVKLGKEITTVDTTGKILTRYDESGAALDGARNFSRKEKNIFKAAGQMGKKLFPALRR